MPAGLRGLRRIQIGAETVKGTPVVATAQLVGQLGMRLEQGLWMPDDQETGRMASFERSEVIARQVALPFNSDATYEQLQYMLEMGVTRGASTGTNPVEWTYRPPQTATANPRSYTMEYGDNIQAYESTLVGCSQLELSGQVGDVLKVNATLFGQDMAETTFTTGLTPPTRESIKMGTAKLYVDTSWANLTGNSPTEVPGTLIDSSYKVMNGFSPQKFADGNLSYTEIAEAKRHVEWDMTVAFNATTKDWFDDLYREQGVRVVGMHFTGTPITAGDNTTVKYLRLQVSAKLVEFGELADREGQNIVRLKWRSEYLTDRDFQILLGNALTAIP